MSRTVYVNGEYLPESDAKYVSAASVIADGTTFVPAQFNSAPLIGPGNTLPAPFRLSVL